MFRLLGSTTAHQAFLLTVRTVYESVKRNYLDIEILW
jgi:hypothetical protein